MTGFLEPLRDAVTNRLSDTNLTVAQRRALLAAAKNLSRNAKSAQQELKFLAIAAKSLSARFSNDFAFEEEETLGGYSYDLNTLLADIAAVVATNPLPKNVTNKLAQGTAALERGEDSGNSVPVRARALALSLTKLDLAARDVIRLLGPAPASIEDRRNLDLDENAPVNDQTFYRFHIPTWTYNSHNPEELGLWTYQRTGPSNAIVTVMPNWPSNDVPRDFQLRFTSFSGGTFTATDQTRQPFQGTFKTIR